MSCNDIEQDTEERRIVISTAKAASVANDPLVSIGLPVYNGERYLDAALRSLVDQTYANIELIICDNASTDATSEICLKYTRSDPRVKYFRNETNIGGANNHNLCFGHANGKYFRWAAHDDVLSPDLIEKCVDFLERNPSIVLCCTDCVVIDEWSVARGTYRCVNGSSPDIFKRFVQLAGGHPCYEAYGLMRRDIVQKTGLLRNYPDADRTFLVHLGLFGEFHSIAEPLFQKRDHPGMSTHKFPDFYHRYEWFGEGHKNRLAPPHLVQFCHLLEVIWSSPIPAAIKLKCYAYMLKWIVRHRAWLAYEMPRFWRRLIGKEHA